MSSFNIEYIYSIVDRYSPVIKKIARSTDNFKTVAKRASASLAIMSKRMKTVGRSAMDLGRKISTRVTLPIMALGGVALHVWNKQAQAVEQVRVGIESTGGVANKSLEELMALAQKMQRETIFGDEEILAGVTAQLLTFTNIANEEFDRTQQAVLDVGTRLAATRGGAADLTSTAIMLGKALNDPVANLGALSRSGIQFSKSQKEVIKALVESGNLAKAQSLILKELETQYGGAARAAAAVGTGGLKQLKNELFDTLELFGPIIYKGLIPLIDKIRELSNHIKGLTPSNKKLIIQIALIASTIGPVIMILGTLAFVIGALMTPIGLVLGGIALLAGAIASVTLNWQLLKNSMMETAVFQTIAGVVQMVANGINSLIQNVDMLIDKMQNSVIAKFVGKLGSVANLATGGLATFGGAIDVNLNAPKGTVKSIATKSNNKNFNLGTNMRQS